MTALDLLMNAGKGMAGAYAVSQIASQNNVKVSVNGQSIHHDIGGIVVVGASTVLYLLKMIPKEWAALGVGFGGGAIAHHLLTENEGCKEGVCLHRISNMR